jgi:hypothetical protein
MKRAAILVLAIATLVMIVSPSAYPLASVTPTKSGTSAPSIISPGASTISGPSNSTGDGGSGGGGGTDQGDADGLSGMKVKPGALSNFTTPYERIAITMMMWWRYMLFIR